MSKQNTNTLKSKGNKDNNKKKEEVKKEEYEEMNGSATFNYPNGDIYIGEFKQLTTGDKIREGKGKYIINPSELHPNGIESYDGEWKEDKMNGYGVYHYSNGEIYEGNWADNMHNGQGTYKFANGTCYVGEWENHKMNGTGKFIYLNQKSFDGVFTNGEYHTSEQANLLDEKRIKIKIDQMKELAKDFYNIWEDVYTKADKKTIKDALAPFFANPDAMGKYVKATFPKLDEKTPDKWNDAFKFVYGLTTAKAAKGGEEIKPVVTINVPKNADELIFMEKDSLLVPQVQEELASGQVIEIMTTLESRKVCLGLAYFKEEDRWVVVFFNDITEKAAKK